MDIWNNPSVVIDNGSGVTKAGFSGQDSPRSVLPSIIGRPNEQDSNKHEFYIGDKAQLKREVLTITNPIQEGFIRNWDDMEKIWHHIFDQELRVEPTSQPLLLTEAPLNSKSNREKMAEIMFETFKVPAMYIANQAALALYYSGRTTGLVLDLGDGGSRAVPIYNGSVISNAILRSSISGTDLTDYLMKLLIEGSHNITTTLNPEDVKYIKEHYCYVAGDYEKACSGSSESQDCTTTHTLADGNVITIRDELFRCPEVLFRPSLIMRDDLGIDQLVYNSIKKCDASIQKDLCGHIVPSGGSSVFRGITDRLIQDVATLAPPTKKIHGVMPFVGKYATWIGGSQMANSAGARYTWILKDEYEEYGAEIVHSKCG